MNKPPKQPDQIVEIYRRRAQGYDASGISGLGALRQEAVKTLNLKRGDCVVDIGCGTGLNFLPLQEAVESEGKIIGVDLTDAMLEQAQQRVSEHGWKNVELVQSDATEYIYPDHIDGIISVFALSFVPDSARVIQNGVKALSPRRKWVVLDMAWPQRLPPWLRHGLFFLSSWGITREVIQRRPWETVWQTMEQHLTEVERKQFWMGFFYLVSGTKLH